jgi:hypothetical protein
VKNFLNLIILQPIDRITYDHKTHATDININKGENLSGNIESQTAKAAQKMASRSYVGYWKKTVGETTAHCKMVLSFMLAVLTWAHYSTILCDGAGAFISRFGADIILMIRVWLWSQLQVHSV